MSNFIVADIILASIYVVWTFGGQSPCTYLDSYFSTHLCSISTRSDEVYHVVNCSD